MVEFDSVKPEANLTGLPVIELLNLQSDLEDIYLMDIDNLMKRYRKIWRFLFFKYSTFGAKQSNQSTQQPQSE